METIQYIGESVWQGAVGHLLVIVAFVTALAGSFANFKAVGETAGWLNVGRSMFAIHALSVFAIIGLLLAIMIGQRYEYVYVWEHVSEDLPMRYIFSAFWEGQEGSFLLWMLWHAVLGIFLLRSGKFEAPVMGTLLLVEVFITSMLLGIHITDDIKIGVNPFALLRETMQAPIFARADYLTMIEGNGLNPLLQNYWMTIHPPTLFLGFASVTVPFCFAMGGLITKDHTGWLRPAMPWALFSAAILGTGILMGGAWAYEALSFGGYWAWDPVENMSLVPWLILVAGIHAHLISRSTGESMRTAYALYIASFLLILYSTFLTRSGVLGDSSAHAFTQMGLEWQLVAFIGFFGLWSAWVLAKNWKGIPTKPDAPANTRSFWMFIGTLVLIFSAVLISFTTSIPVWNKIASFAGDLFNADYSDLHRTAPVDPVAHYNKFQLWIAVFIGILAGVAQFLRYRETNWASRKKAFLKDIGVSLVTAAGLAVALSLWINANAWQYVVLLGSAAFAITSNITYLIDVGRKSPKLATSALAHLGFGIMIVGVMASGLNKETISTNPFAQAGLMDDVDEGSFITLIKGRPMFMNNYWVTYEQDTVKGNVREFLVSYKRINAEQDTVERFQLRPNVVYNNKKTKVEATNPSTKHYLDQDIFTYVAALPGEQMDIEEAKKINDTLDYQPFTLTMGDTLITDKFKLWPIEFTDRPQHADYIEVPGDLALQLKVGIYNIDREETYWRDVVVYLRDGLVYGYPAQINDLNMRIRLSNDAIREYYVHEDDLEFTEFSLKSGEQFEFDNYTVKMEGVDRVADHPRYVPQPDDIAVNAVLSITDGASSVTSKPLYYIRGTRPGTVKDFIPTQGLHVYLDKIDPEDERFYYRIAKDARDRTELTAEIAQNVPRNDIIVIEAIVFPGINLFWAGSVMMMIGLFWAMFVKRREARRS